MYPVVGLIAIIDSVRDGHCTVSGYVQPQHQLLQIGAMILVLSISELFTRAPASVFSDKSYSRCVMMNLPAIEIEDFDGPECQSKENIFVAAVIKLL